MDEEEACLRVGDPAMEAARAAQDAALAGQKGAALWAVSTADGSQLAAYSLNALPVFDGMAAAGRRLYLATAGGAVICFAGK